VNITFLIYHFQDDQDLSATNSFKSGDMAPSFILQTTKGIHISQESLNQAMGTVINFVTANCPYCNQQLPVLNAVAMQLASSSYQFINVSSALTDDLTQQASSTEWVEDKEGNLHHLFKVKAYPTTFVIGNDGKIKQVILGVPENFEASLLTNMLTSS
jgi:peroxiredoxin